MSPEQKKELERRISVMQAFLDGKQVEFRDNGDKTWQAAPQPAWNWYERDYRIKQEPKKLFVVVSSAACHITVTKEEAHAKNFINSRAGNFSIEEYTQVLKEDA